MNPAVPPKHLARLQGDLRPNTSENRPPVGVRFRYTGKTALTVIGPASRHHYRFAHHAAMVDVAPADAAALALVPCLQRETTQ